MPLVYYLLGIFSVLSLSRSINVFSWHMHSNYLSFYNSFEWRNTNKKVHQLKWCSENFHWIISNCGAKIVCCHTKITYSINRIDERMSAKIVANNLLPSSVIKIENMISNGLYISFFATFSGDKWDNRKICFSWGEPI